MISDWLSICRETLQCIIAYSPVYYIQGVSTSWPVIPNSSVETFFVSTQRKSSRHKDLVDFHRAQA